MPAILCTPSPVLGRGYFRSAPRAQHQALGDPHDDEATLCNGCNFRHGIPMFTAMNDKASFALLRKSVLLT